MVSHQILMADLEERGTIMRACEEGRKEWMNERMQDVVVKAGSNGM